MTTTADSAASSNSPDGASIVARAVAALDTEKGLAPEQQDALLDLLEYWEAWSPYFRVLKRMLLDTKRRRSDDYLRLARAQNRLLEDINSAAETCRHLVTEMALPWSRMRDEVLPRVVEAGDFATEARILEAVCPQFRDATDNVECLERLCFLYEKKVHNETRLATSYERLLAADPLNMKALRYFKLVYAQCNEWNEVVSILRKIMSRVKRPQELFRAAQELAGVYLYQLDQADRAVRVLQEHCADSPLDTSTIAYDAYQRLGDADGCLRVLRQCVLTVNDDVSRAILHFKMGVLHEQLGQRDPAYDCFLKASRLWTTFLDPVEGAISISIARKDWPAVLQHIADMSDRVQDGELASQLRQAAQRLETGLESVAQGAQAGNSARRPQK